MYRFLLSLNPSANEACNTMCVIGVDSKSIVKENSKRIKGKRYKVKLGSKLTQQLFP
jgi:hypothetical protein